MSKQRLVLETSEERKAALAARLDLQGESFAEWIDDQIEDAIEPTYADLADGMQTPSSMSKLLETDALSVLEGVDWSFTSADTRYLTHDLHPYPAKFPPQIPAHLIAALSMPGDTVFDPFGGSGTTAVEAVRLKRSAVSLDANPLSALVGRAKVACLNEASERELESLGVAVQSYVSEAKGKTERWSQELMIRHANQVPEIPNFEKWFCNSAASELALLRHLILSFTSGVAEDVAHVAFARIVTRVSNQDSETRYVAKPKDLPAGFTLRAFQESLRTVVKKLQVARSTMRGASANFLEADTRLSIPELLPPSSVDLIVTSPPYPNATDYHLYHRFRLFWLGFDPRKFGAVEIGSHLKHQRKGTDFSEYVEEMEKVLSGCFEVLQPGRFAVFVVGDAVFKGTQFSTSGALAEIAKRCGYQVIGTISRPIHNTKRSFAQPARRARSEQLLVLRRPNSPIQVTITGPAYKMWGYERTLRASELDGLGLDPIVEADAVETVNLEVQQPQLWNLRRTAFSTFVTPENSSTGQPVWQKVLENGDADRATRKDPKYATHGLHAYKGKFYPQLAKSLLNSSGIDVGSTVLDPYCGSGTVPLECLLNGYRAVGFDMNPLAAKIARAKSGILLIDPELVELAAQSLVLAIPEKTPKLEMTQFPDAAHAELERWFSTPVLAKINFLLGRIRLLGNATLVDFFEVLVSSIVREVSQQEPSDLRIRRRKAPIVDAPVFELFLRKLEEQMMRLQKYWSIAARQLGERLAPSIFEADSRLPLSFSNAGVAGASVDCVVTSPPYATALPYIDTDRLSILALMGISSSERSRVEEHLTGSREIKTKDRLAFESEIISGTVDLPEPVLETLNFIREGNESSNVGFRRKNMPALLLRYFRDIGDTLKQVKLAMKPGALAYYVVGDSRTKVGDDWFAIPTCLHVAQIAENLGLEVLPHIQIDVTTERMLHMKNAITENDILIFRKS
ncbi:DNA methyltransferase [Vannielia sp. SX4]|uniref:DNA methyltransferase n=1 Tax=Vannielia sp. SX4 TaxID=3463852 RepID=UPI00405839C1